MTLAEFKAAMNLERHLIDRELALEAELMRLRGQIKRVSAQINQHIGRHPKLDPVACVIEDHVDSPQGLRERLQPVNDAASPRRT